MRTSLYAPCLSSRGRQTLGSLAAAVAVLIATACSSPSPGAVAPITWGDIGTGGPTTDATGLDAGADDAGSNDGSTTTNDASEDSGTALDGTIGGDDTMAGDAGTTGGDTGPIDDGNAGDTGMAQDSDEPGEVGDDDGEELEDGNPVDTGASGGGEDGEDGGVSDADDPDGSWQDTGNVGDTGGVKDTGEGNGNDGGSNNGGGDPFGADVPWGSEEDAAPYDAGPPNYPDASAGGVPANICTPQLAELNLKEEKVGGKVDVVWWIDTSGSMSQEAKYLNDNINKFATFIAAANIDFRMILVGNGFSMCVQPPLGGPGCTDGPQFQHKKITIGSTNGPSVLISQYATWSTFLRPDASKNIVAVTDDNQSTPPTCTTQCSSANGGALGQVCSQCKAQWFIDELQKKDPVNFPPTPATPYGFVHHSIVAYETAADCPTIAQKGAAYLQLTAMTGGAKFKICETNWAPIFQALAQSVVQTAKPGCEYGIPFPATVKPNPNIGVNYVAKDDLFAVPSAQNNTCPSSGVGFTLDDPKTPQKITLCPASCDLLKGGGNIQFDFGCF